MAKMSTEEALEILTLLVDDCGREETEEALAVLSNVITEKERGGRNVG